MAVAGVALIQHIHVLHKRIFSLHDLSNYPIARFESFHLLREEIRTWRWYRRSTLARKTPHLRTLRSVPSYNNHTLAVLIDAAPIVPREISRAENVLILDILLTGLRLVIFAVALKSKIFPTGDLDVRREDLAEPEDFVE